MMDGLPDYYYWFKPDQENLMWIDRELREDTPQEIREEFEKFKQDPEEYE